MTEGVPFAEFLKRIRAGDERAAEELVSRFEPLIRREVRLHLDDPRLSRLLDSMDISQSVFGSFFLRAVGGEYDLEQPAQLAALLVKMTRNKLASAARRQSRQKRDIRRAGPAEAMDAVSDNAPTPSRILCGKEMLDRIRQELTEEEWQIAMLRQDGLAWADIAARLGGTAQSRRMQLARAVDRVDQGLGLEEDEPEKI